MTFNLPVLPAGGARSVRKWLRGWAWVVCSVLVAGIACAAPAPSVGDYLFVWAGDADKVSGDVFAVVDIAPDSPRFGEVVSSVATGVAGSSAHHTEHLMPPGGLLFANDFGSGRTFIVNLTDPLKPAISGSFTNAGELMHPHSFVRLPNGNVLATFQMSGHENAEPGGLAEITPDGSVIRTSAAADALSDDFIRPYSLAVLPALDRVVTTSADMHESAVSRSVQVWRLSDLKLLKTVKLPPGPQGMENNDPAEPRVLADGRTVLVSTFSCGLYRMTGLDGPSPGAEWVATFPGAGKQGVSCALPVVAGNYWVQTDPSIPGLISFDVSDPGHPKEAGRLVLREGEVPHWISLAPDGARIVIGGYGALAQTVLLARIDRNTGAMTLFTPGGRRGISFAGSDWPHGQTGPMAPHGAVFSRRD